MIDYVITVCGGRAPKTLEEEHFVLWELNLIAGRQYEHGILCSKGIRCRRAPTIGGVETTMAALAVDQKQRASVKFVEE